MPNRTLISQSAGLLTLHVRKPHACWLKYSPSLKSVFVIDTAQANVTVLGIVDGSIKDTVNYTVIGGIDPTTIGFFLHLLTKFASVVNIDFAGLGRGAVSKTGTNLCACGSQPQQRSCAAFRPRCVCPMSRQISALLCVQHIMKHCYALVDFLECFE